MNLMNLFEIARDFSECMDFETLAEFLFKNRARESWVKAGAYAQPAIVCCDEPNHPLVQEETMSPLLVVQRAENFAHALALCNGVRHGLRLR